MIIDQKKENITNYRARCSTVVQTLTLPSFVPDQGVTLYCKVNKILTNDNNTSSVFKDLANLTETLFKTIENKAELFKDLTNSTIETSINKKADLKYNTGTHIQEIGEIKNGTYIIRDSVKTDSREIYLKIQLLEEYKKWLEKNKNTLLENTTVVNDTNAIEKEEEEEEEKKAVLTIRAETIAPPTNKEKALAYLFDLDANNEEVPKHKIDGRLKKGEIEKIGREKGYTGSSFYDAVKDLHNEWDRYNKESLGLISLRWVEVVGLLSHNNKKTMEHLKEKGLL